jgi:homocysteine S-methyltransferase
MIPSSHRTSFPSADTLVVTDAGLETWLLFDRGVDLTAFAAYPLAGTDEGRALLTDYYARYLAIAESAGAALLLEAPTWRANPDWAATLGHDRAQLASLISASIKVVDDLRNGWHHPQPCLVGGVVGPRGDGYQADTAITADQAADYHSFQLDCMAATPIDLATALTICSTEEAIGIAMAAERAGVPVVISFTVETDGRLPSGATLAEAITTTDAATGGYPLHYMVNCAHPSHFADVLDGEAWIDRLRGVRANASYKSHAELDESTELDAGDPDDLAAWYADLRERLPKLHVVGGCCGTDHRHIAAIVRAAARSDGHI